MLIVTPPVTKELYEKVVFDNTKYRSRIVIIQRDLDAVQPDY